MKPLCEWTETSQIRGVFTDIDDTLTEKGKLSAEAYNALWALKNAGFWVIPITGRPAGWCDLIARQWPVDAVIGENGALAFYEKAGRLHRLFHPEVASPTIREQLHTVRQAILAEVQGARVAQDQAYRIFDLAIDFAEEEPVLDLNAAEAILQVFLRHKATAKISSIHVNGWFGAYDKLSMAKLLMHEHFGVDLLAQKDQFVFVGDSPNDEPLFSFFPHSCAVANIQPFVDRLTSLPSYVTQAPGGRGFSEVANHLLHQRMGGA